VNRDRMIGMAILIVVLIAYLLGCFEAVPQ
jgi:hypothetical protein